MNKKISPRAIKARISRLESKLEHLKNNYNELKKDKKSLNALLIKARTKYFEARIMLKELKNS